MTDYRFSGRERATVELDGWFRPGGLAVPRRLALELDGDGRARVRLFAFHVDDLRIARVPVFRASYAEILWRVAVRAGDTPAWWIAACDLGAWTARLAAARYVRYPVRRGKVDVSLDHVRADGLAISLGPAGTEEIAPEPRPVLVGANAEWEVPFADDGPPARPAVATVEADSLAEQTLQAPVTWAPAAFVRVNRQHRCGAAHSR
ncbi:MAG: hypothetical protein ACM31C_02085 [Acidobacteriota bacterium]